MHSQGKIIIFDWDDTLFPTFISSVNRLEIDYKNLFLLDKSIVNLLSSTMNRGTACSPVHLFIVTNSKKGWIKSSSSRYLPLTYRFIEKYNNDAYNFCVISARSSFASLFPKNPVAWKVCAFEKILEIVMKSGQNFDAPMIVSYGDGFPERAAVMEMSKSNGIVGKSIQFIQSPKTIKQIIHQLRLVKNTMDEILSIKHNLDLAIISDGNNFYFTDNV